MKYLFIFLTLIGCTKSNMWMEQSQPYQVWRTSKIQTLTPGHYCPINIISHSTDIVCHADPHEVRQDSVVNGLYYYTAFDSLIENHD